MASTVCVLPPVLASACAPSLISSDALLSGKVLLSIPAPSFFLTTVKRAPTVARPVEVLLATRSATADAIAAAQGVAEADGADELKAVQTLVLDPAPLPLPLEPLLLLLPALGTTPNGSGNSAVPSTSSSSFRRLFSSWASRKPASSSSSPGDSRSFSSSIFESRLNRYSSAPSMLWSLAPSLLFIVLIASRSSKRCISAATSMDFCSNAFI
mmetsp:Transcript_13924/g.37967  ORF Transcript_13924/g.37967 Transcript_13924/m.37967 type:complete len:212 (-) Transcript_13924:575-1210(-)